MPVPSGESVMKKQIKNVHIQVASLDWGKHDRGHQQKTLSWETYLEAQTICGDQLIIVRGQNWDYTGAV